MSSISTDTTKDCAVVLGADGFPQWSALYADAWIGLLATHRRLTRELDAERRAVPVGQAHVLQGDDRGALAADQGRTGGDESF